MPSEGIHDPVFGELTLRTDGDGGCSMLEIDIVAFVLRGTIGPFSAQTHRADIVSLLGLPDQPSYPAHVVYGNLCFDLMGGVGPLALVQIGIPHEGHSRCPHPDWAKTWTPPTWLNAWPDSRFLWGLGPFVPDATLSDIQAAIPELRELKPERPLWQASGDGCYLMVPSSGAMIGFESARQGGVKTLSHITGPPRA